AVVLAYMLILSGVRAQNEPHRCPDAPLPRLMVGEQAAVAPGVDRLRLRALPAVRAGEIRLLYAGRTFEVLAGPSCNGGYNWWRVQTAEGMSGWVAEGTWEQYYLRPVREAPVPLCQRAETPIAHLLLTIACRLLSG
ncbi:MAG: SH3 domain-containing protein, partial [Anaerolineae bacterium]|nr:SH3 domain-containing protein [Anaerolineae bacterium]